MDYDEDSIEEDEYEEDDFDCGMCIDSDGRLAGCQLAGTEECDWDCPYRRTYEAMMARQAGRVRPEEPGK